MVRSPHTTWNQAKPAETERRVEEKRNVSYKFEALKSECSYPLLSTVRAILGHVGRIGSMNRWQGPSPKYSAHSGRG